ncbi:SprT-like domain-containing protein [Leucobacter sp. HY1910]
MSNMNRQAAGTKQAGVAVGGRFAASQQTEASGAGLSDRTVVRNDLVRTPPPAPNFRKLLNATPDEWFATPWAQRKKVVEQATREIIDHTPEAAQPPFGTPVTFGGWMQSKRAIGWNKKTQYRGNPALNENKIELSTPQVRMSEPATIANTILHEVAHGIDDLHGGHGEGWKEKFRTLLRRHDLDEASATRVHHATEAERNAPVHLMRRYRGNCPNDPTHATYRDGKPRTARYICTQGECRQKPQRERFLTYDKNPDFRG